MWTSEAVNSQVEGKDVTVHIPVLTNEVLEFLKVGGGGRFLDCTVGGAGHLEAMLTQSSEISVVGIDRDKRALERAKERLAPFTGRFSLSHRSFQELKELANEGPFDGVLADLGLSSDQLSEERGFSFRDDAPLDMRMNPEDELTAGAIVNEYNAGALSRVLRVGGLRKNVKRYVSTIIEKRPINTAKELGELIANATPMRDQKDSHPATVVFQALRMEVNGEKKQIDALLKAVPKLVRPGGRFACISFHSLEDQLVAGQMRKWKGESAPANFPGMEGAGRESLGKLLTNSAVTPTDEEVEQNPRSRSARMRVFEFSSS